MRWLWSIGVLGVSLAVLHGAPPAALAADDLMQMIPQGQAVNERPASADDQALLDGLAAAPNAVTVARILAGAERQPQVPRRGAKEVTLYREVSPSVVMVVVQLQGGTGLGSGSVIADGEVLTSWHVIDGAQHVGIVFKPAEEGRAPTRADFVVAKVVKTDEVSDLALLEYPPGVRSVTPIALGTPDEIEIGADVDAIGHPTGEVWTFTRGVISQFRKDYPWRTGRTEHKADVIQTQTPINPGNSGGPLLSTAGHLIGVNAFKEVEEGVEGLNFAVSVEDVQKFIAEPTGRTAIREPVFPRPKCKPRLIYDGRNKENTAHIKLIDFFCTGRANAVFIVPDDVHRSVSLWLDTAGRGHPDVWIYDANRDHKWDYSLIASNPDGKVDLIGYHPDGGIIPSRYERYHGQPTPWAN